MENKIFGLLCSLIQSNDHHIIVVSPAPSVLFFSNSHYFDFVDSKNHCGFARNHSRHPIYHQKKCDAIKKINDVFLLLKISWPIIIAYGVHLCIWFTNCRQSSSICMSYPFRSPKKKIINNFAKQIIIITILSIIHQRNNKEECLPIVVVITMLPKKQQQQQ